eukprot:gnl/TRDRNA2_/TRDRNA2_158639_c0_seq2.p1 gnl/TRDRNA2_/TRDRNA2_158639_c0~~gnl/TRDRNA2_/TRDRNA2_158639_c0_seq2.p1  ORF type:complete len:171 (-),score=20.57 gnl/TRDRNA2_/TRDRNA2_158639_c0_seq2:73-585(-)
MRSARSHAGCAFAANSKSSKHTSLHRSALPPCGSPCTTQLIELKAASQRAQLEATAAQKTNDAALAVSPASPVTSSKAAAASMQTGPTSSPQSLRKPRASSMAAPAPQCDMLVLKEGGSILANAARCVQPRVGDNESSHRLHRRILCEITGSSGHVFEQKYGTFAVQKSW